VHLPPPSDTGSAKRWQHDARFTLARATNIRIYTCVHGRMVSHKNTIHELYFLFKKIHTILLHAHQARTIMARTD
jgi:hypothetical protein